MALLHQPERALTILTVALIMIGCRTPEPAENQQSLAAPSIQMTAILVLELAQETPTLNPIASTTQEEATSTAAVIPDTGWQLLRPGLERRQLTNHREGAAVPEKFYMLRIDDAYFRFNVGYHPGEPQRLVDWMTETGAFIVVNGGFFTELGEATGAVIVSGQPSGTGYQGFGGMLTITETETELRWLPQRPYNLQEPIAAGLQSFPMLVQPGNQIGYPDEDGAPARRTVIAQDRQGRLLFILATSGTYTLHQLSRFLVASDLDLDLALNLDGGSSTGLILADPVEGVPPFTLLPLVITVHPR